MAVHMAVHRLTAMAADLCVDGRTARDAYILETAVRTCIRCHVYELLLDADHSCPENMPVSLKKQTVCSLKNVDMPTNLLRVVEKF